MEQMKALIAKRNDIPIRPYSRPTTRRNSNRCPTIAPAVAAEGSADPGKAIAPTTADPPAGDDGK